MVTTKFAIWRRACFGDNLPVALVQDHEKCLWQERNLLALTKAKCPALQNYPKYSPDMNAIEGWWRVLRERLEETAPEEIETRSEFIIRMRRTVHWLNENRWEDALALCQNQKVRANESKKLSGAKTSW